MGERLGRDNKAVRGDSQLGAASLCSAPTTETQATTTSTKTVSDGPRVRQWTDAVVRRSAIIERRSGGAYESSRQERCENGLDGLRFRIPISPPKVDDTCKLASVCDEVSSISLSRSCSLAHSSQLLSRNMHCASRQWTTEVLEMVT